jgi:cysteine desulfurase
MQAQIHGGGHEQGLRSGTLATHQIVGMGSAFALAGELMGEENQRIAGLGAQLREGLLSLPGVRLNGCARQRVPHTLNLCIDHPFFNVQGLGRSLAFSSTSACNSASRAPSHVLLALGLDATQAYSSIRLSLGRYTTLADVEAAIEAVRQCLPQ